MRLIDADAVKDVIAELNENGYDISPSDLAFVRNILLRMPTIEPKKGKWIDGKYMGFDGCFVWHRECSECWYERDDDDPDKDTNYCPNCGAKMERSEE